MTTTAINTYMHLALRATAETLRRNPLTGGYAVSFHALARQRGMYNARAWLLGRLIMDLHPEPHTIGAPPRLDPSPDDQPTDFASPNCDLLSLQQNIETPHTNK